MSVNVSARQLRSGDFREHVMSALADSGLPGWLVDAGSITINLPHTVGLTTLWAAAALTVITGWDYLRVGLKHMD